MSQKFPEKSEEKIIKFQSFAIKKDSKIIKHQRLFFNE